MPKEDKNNSSGNGAGIGIAAVVGILGFVGIVLYVILNIAIQVGLYAATGSGRFFSNNLSSMLNGFTGILLLVCYNFLTNLILVQECWKRNLIVI